MNNRTIFDLLKNSQFGVPKTCRNFSSITADHLYEQSNKIVKEDGEAMKDSSEWTRWVVSGIDCTDRTNSARS